MRRIPATGEIQQGLAFATEMTFQKSATEAKAN